MGPYLIFDKSFLESLTLDEAVWLDNFFLTNITPIFYVETLADLEKESKKGKVSRSAEGLVEELVNKTPILEAVPGVYHQKLIVCNLLGETVEMTIHHRPIISGGEYKVSPNGEIIITFQQFPEAAALDRWRKHEFLEVERELARDWRQALSNINIEPFIAQIKKEIPDGINSSSMEDIKKFVDTFVKSRYSQFIYLAFNILDIPDKFRRSILRRWHNTRPMPFNEFAPYATYVLAINLFFYLCLDKSFLSVSHKGKSTNIIDLAYLYYLPFCMVFVSNDNLHKRIAPLFIGQEQTFLSGSELKEDLHRLNDYYSKLPDKVKNMGNMRFAAYPPEDQDTLVGRLFDRHLRPWRKNAKSHRANLFKPLKHDKELLRGLKAQEKDAVPYSGSPIPSDQASSITLKRIIPVKRGNWRILPIGIENK